ncbi:MAG: carboxypeptidase-like regulatory domain-containing protein [Chitinophagaceae bacterium]|nr:carboxypeptidase-like regulatory domain-containing protein [Chitinophagaceae bacterium]
MRTYKTCIFYCIVIIIFINTQKVKAQTPSKKKIVQFSGIVLGTDSITGVPGVHIYVNKGGRGTTSNMYGYFSMPALVGDSILITAIGYKKQSLIIPGNKGDHFTLVIDLKEDILHLPTIEILPYPSEELFKKAILSLNLPIENDYRNLNTVMKHIMEHNIAYNIPMTASDNYRYYMNQYYQSGIDKYQVRTNPLTNPFAWASLIKSIKKGNYKKK